MLACIGPQPLNVITNSIILIIELIIIVSVTNKIFSLKTFETQEMLNKHTVFKENYKYWIIGNTIPLAIIIFHIILIEWIIPFCEGMDTDTQVAKVRFIINGLFYVCHFQFFIIFISLSLFLTSLIVKLLKKDLPFYFYASINLFSLILGYPFFGVVYNSVPQCYGIIKDDYRVNIFTDIFFFIIYIIIPIIGGFIVDIYRCFKNSFSLLHK